MPSYGIGTVKHGLRRPTMASSLTAGLHLPIRIGDGISIHSEAPPPSWVQLKTVLPARKCRSCYISPIVWVSKYVGDRGSIVASSLSQGNADTQVQQTGGAEQEEVEDNEYIRQIMQVLEILRQKRDMTFNEVRLTIMIEDPREAEQKRQIGIEGGCSRKELAAALLDVYEGRVPKDRFVLRELAKEMLSWPNLEAEVETKRNPMESPYAKVTEIGVDPKLAAQRAKVDWDAATEVRPEDKNDMGESVPPVLGFGALYLVSALPIIIGIAVVLILFLNSLQ